MTTTPENPGSFNSFIEALPEGMTDKEALALYGKAVANFRQSLPEQDVEVDSNEQLERL